MIHWSLLLPSASQLMSSRGNRIESNVSLREHDAIRGRLGAISSEPICPELLIWCNAEQEMAVSGRESSGHAECL